MNFYFNEFGYTSRILRFPSISKQDPMARSKKGAHKQEEKPNAEHRERLLDETTYHDMDTPVSAEPGFVTRKVQRNRAWCSFVWLGLIAVGVVGIIAILKASKQADEFPTKKPSFPSQYEASLTFRMPYMNLVEPVFVHVDEMLGAQKLSFYGGMFALLSHFLSYIVGTGTQEYILNVSGPSFQLIPVISSIRCIADGPSSLQHIFPDLSRFEPVYGKTLVNSIDCFSWKYDVAGSPDNSSYFGTYKLFVNAATNEPVQFHFVGHNVILGGSHTDEYIIDYNYVRAGPGLSYSLAMNHLGDLTPNEMKAFLGHKTVKRALDNRAGGVYEVQNIALPDEWDWRTKGGVTPGQWFRKTNQTVGFSQQNLLDCSWDEGNNACNGGLDYQAYRWIIKHGGLEPEVTYGTYKNLPGFCHFNASNALAAVTSYVNISGVQALNEALVTVGPLSVSIDATPPSFYFYSGGYYNDLNCKSGIDDLDHSVLIPTVTRNAVTIKRYLGPVCDLHRLFGNSALSRQLVDHVRDYAAPCTAWEVMYGGHDDMRRFTPTGKTFTLSYGSGSVAGTVFEDVITFGASTSAVVRCRMGQIEIEDVNIQHFESEGIVGLGFGALAAITTHPFVEAVGLAAFSLYINPLPTDIARSSQLVLGGTFGFKSNGAMMRLPA
ncbi:hypothetical protein DYB32_007797 [Aphanomyces invadans]|uniref:Peptidase A1 domain-containing protein n=1 Tax=Aphanomyces invadans TaxID=157072 RepID=A0A3R6V6P1_9STRA|nr:hypothetical protein DYB32_007797 [Aphanomyces invadans]